MSDVDKCPKCGGERQRRFLRASGGGAFIELSDSESVWKWGNREKIVAFTCQKCGSVELFRDMRMKQDRTHERSRGLVR